MSVPSDFFDGRKFVPARLANHITSNIAGYHLITPRTDDGGDITWRYHEDVGIFRSDGAGYIKKLADEALGVKTSPGHVNATLFVAQIRTYMNREAFEEEPGLVVLKNGVYHIDTGEITKHSPLHFAKSALPVTYVPDARCPLFLKFLERVAPTYMEFLQEWTGYHLLKDQRYQRFVVLLGDRDSGKSTYLHVLTHFLGVENVSHESLFQISTDRFSIERLYGKLANIAADIGPTELKLTGALKLATGEDIGSAQKKYGQKFDFMSYAKLSFSCNQLPKTPDETGAFHKRPLRLKFNVTIPLEEQDKTLKAKLVKPEELSGILNWAIEGLRRLLERGQFDEPTTVEERRIQWQHESDPVLAFVEGHIIEDVEEYENPEAIYTAFVRYCKDQGFVLPSDTTFYKELKKHVYYQKTRPTINKQRITVFEGIKLKESVTPVTSVRGTLTSFYNTNIDIEIGKSTHDRGDTPDSSSSEPADPAPTGPEEQLFADAIKILAGQQGKMQQRYLFAALMKLGYNQLQADQVLRADPRLRFMGTTVKLLEPISEEAAV